MALIKCIECGKDVSDTSEKCPHCGYTLTEESKERGSKMAKKEIKSSFGLVALLFAIILPIVGFILGIVGIVKDEKYSIFALFLSLLMPILYYIILNNYFGSILF